MSTTRRSLTTTSFAILGLLNLRTWTGYELAQQMSRSLGYIWPRATSAIYEEPRVLVGLRLAEAAEEKTGRRPKTVYSITQEGRQALRAWLAQDSAAPQFESEALVRISFPEAAPRRILLENIRRLAAQADEIRTRVNTQARGYLEPGHGPFPERLQVIALDARFVSDYARFLARWASWAEAQVASWPARGTVAVGDSLEVLRHLDTPVTDGPVTVREMGADEAPLVAGLTLHAYAEFSSQLPQPTWSAYQVDLLDVASRAASGAMFVAELGGEVVGAVCYMPQAPVLDGVPDGFAFIRTLAVSPMARRRGVGLDLATACISRARTQGRRGIGLQTSDLMLAARTLYTNLGFHEVRSERHPMGVTLQLFLLNLG